MLLERQGDACLRGLTARQPESIDSDIGLLLTGTFRRIDWISVAAGPSITR